MFISDQYKLVFFEVPRTGSNSVTEALSELDPESPTISLRQDLNRYANYHRFEIPEHAESYRLLAAHRNPYERLWSFWKFRYCNGSPEIFRTTPWHRYVKWACDPSSAPEIQEAMLDIPICEMFDCGRVTHWLRFESLAESWNDIRYDLGLELPDLKVKQASPFMSNYREAYDDELAAMVAVRFEQDFEMFGYDPSSWRRRKSVIVSATKAHSMTSNS